MLGAKLGILNKSYNIITNGLVWHQEPGMDKCYPGSTLTYNLANMNISGTLVNDATVTGTVPGRAYVMDGSDDYIKDFQFTGIADNSPYSIFMWINFDDVTRTDQRILNHQAGKYSYSWTAGDAGRFQQWVEGSSADGWTNLMENNITPQSGFGNGDWWSFSYTVSDDATSVINSYVNGTQDDIGGTSYTYEDWTGHGKGKWQGSSDYFMNNEMDLGRQYDDTWGKDLDGKMGTFLVYDRVLSSGEILQNYNATKDRYLT